MPGLLVVTPPGPDADVLCANLKDRGFEVHTAASGATAVDVAMRREPEVILMDPALSAMDRWHAVKRLNTDLGTARIPVLTLASDAGSPAGLQRVLAKIERTLGRLPRARTAGRTTPPPTPASTPSPPTASTPGASRRSAGRQPSRADRTPTPPAAIVMPGGPTTTPGWTPPRLTSPRTPRILVVDDNALNRDMLSRRLVRRGYEVEVAEDGESALDRIRHERFDLVLLDWMMPGLSGIDVLHRLREQHSPVELPVIMATAKSEADDVVEALRAEANDYVTKPLNFDVVTARIKTQLGLVRAHRELAQSEGRFRALLENTGDMIVQYQLDGAVLYVSPASRTLLGVEPDELRTRSFYEWLHPIDRRELEEQKSANPTLPPAFSFIARMQRQDGSWIWVETSCRVLREDGATILQAACRDVTEHMEGLAGEEPPLPLGGDIMAHPGWRGGPSRPPSAEPAPSSVPTGVHVTVNVVVEPRDLPLDPDAREQVASRVSDGVRRALENPDG